MARRGNALRGNALRIGLGDKLDRLAPCLSQGERQRVAVARALVTEPQVVLAGALLAGVLTWLTSHFGPRAVLWLVS